MARKAFNLSAPAIRLRVLIGLLIGAFLLGTIYFFSGGGRSSISTTFVRYGVYQHLVYQHLTNEPAAYFIVRNTGTGALYCKGVADSYRRQFVQVLSPSGWVDTRPWLAVDGNFHLSPGESREVAVLVETNLSWRVAFEFRKTGFVDVCPWFVWRILPKMMRGIPEFHEIWSESVPPWSKTNE
jgi:hypothetical protein